MVESFTHQFDSSFYKGSVTLNTGLFVGGKWIQPIDKDTLDVVNPSTGKLLTRVSAASPADVDIAVKVARETFKKSWGLKVPGFERGNLLNRLAALVEEHADQFAALEALNTGKHFVHAKAFDMGISINTLRYYAGWADKNNGQTLEASTTESKFAYTRHEPIGVCALVVPWNFPLMQAICKIAPALATGNTIIVKPSEFTPLTILRFADLVTEAGFPAGTVNILPGIGSVAGQALIDHPDIGKISFTGSTLVGRKIMEGSAKSNLKRVTLELGGKSPAIIFDDAVLDKAIPWVTTGVFHQSGQICMAGSRIFVQEGIYDQFMSRFTAAVKAINIGDAFDPNSHQGPVVSEAHMKRVLGYIESGKTAGATVVTGGSRIGETGFFIQPTIFTDVKLDMKIVREEIFGPVCAVVKFKEEQEVIDLANDTVYGLTASIFTENISRGLRVAHGLETGQAYINSSINAAVQVPFGGVKQSGFGKELGQYALEAYTNVKAVHVNIDPVL
ncbi:aldehyde dehydrogenase [Trametopsis cervina]|nr:aldehyde dehydrogenase [Trametopsis cervina]